MITAIRHLASVALIGGLTAGCTFSSGKNDAPNSTSQLYTAAKQAVVARSAAKPEKTIITTSTLAKIKVPVIQINPERSGGSDFLTRSTSRRDSGLGTIEVWNSSDKAQIFLRNGVLIGTRGIGGDIIAVDANMTIRALSSGVNSTGNRRYTLSDGDVTTTDIRLRCELENLGAENINVANQSFRTRHMRETCVGLSNENLQITNDYWVQPASGLVRKSRQWVNEESGYFEIILLKN